MHAQPQSARARAVEFLSAAIGLGLYLLTLSLEVVVGAGLRWLLIYLGIATLATILPFGASSEAVAWVGALAPIAWSMFGLVLPGRGWLWGRRLGVRRATTAEEMALGDALALLRGADPDLREPAAYYILDDPLPEAAVRGRTLILSRALLECECLAAVVAHELGHVTSLDGRLTEALKRLELWGDLLAPCQIQSGGEARVEDSPGSLIWGLMRWSLRLSGGGFSQLLMGPLWAAHWRAREYAADNHAARLGQAEDLASHLIDQEQPFDSPQPRLLFNSFEHPPVALRVERLLENRTGGWVEMSPSPVLGVDGRIAPDPGIFRKQRSRPP